MLEKEIFERIPFFSEVFQEHFSEIAQLGKVLEYDRNETIYQKGDKAFELYCVIDGAVDLYLTVMDKVLKTDIQYEESIRTHIETIERQIIIESLKPGNIFGWPALIEPRVLTATAKCSKACRLISLPADKLKTFFDQHPRLGYDFMVRLAEIIYQRLENRTNALIEGWSLAFDTNIVGSH